MAVERKNPKLSIFGSFFMIITAGTLYRFSRLNKKIMQTQFSSILEKFGNKLYSKKSITISKYMPSEDPALQL